MARRRQREATAAGVDSGVAASIYVGGAGYRDPSQMPFASPYSTSQLERWAYQEWFGELPKNDRANAMAIPPIARARTLLCVQGAKQPLVQVAGDTPIPVQPYWVTHTGEIGVSPFHRMLWTIDDLIWCPAALWRRKNPGQSLETRSYVPQADWEINAAGDGILIKGKPVSAEEWILIPGPHEGALTFAAEALASLRALYKIVDERIKNPVPQLELHDTEGNMTKEEKDELLAAWREARQRADTQGVAYTSKRIQVIERGQGNDSQLLIEGRNAGAIDGSRIVGIHGGMVDATTPKASLNYETTQGRNQEFDDFDLDAYQVSISSRLSEDDVCTPGERIAFDAGQFTTLTPSPTGPAQGD